MCVLYRASRAISIKTKCFYRELEILFLASCTILLRRYQTYPPVTMVFTRYQGRQFPLVRCSISYTSCRRRSARGGDVSKTSFASVSASGKGRSRVSNVWLSTRIVSGDAFCVHECYGISYTVIHPWPDTTEQRASGPDFPLQPLGKQANSVQ